MYICRNVQKDTTSLCCCFKVIIGGKGLSYFCSFISFSPLPKKQNSGFSCQIQVSINFASQVLLWCEPHHWHAEMDRDTICHLYYKLYLYIDNLSFVSRNHSMCMNTGNGLLIWRQNLTWTKYVIKFQMNVCDHSQLTENFLSLRQVKSMYLTNTYWKCMIYKVKAMVFPVLMYRCESWTIKKAEHQRIDAF